MTHHARSTVIRFEPPLIVSDAEIDRALKAMEKTCRHRGTLGAFAGLGRTILTRRKG